VLGVVETDPHPFTMANNIVQEVVPVLNNNGDGDVGVGVIQEQDAFTTRWNPFTWFQAPPPEDLDEEETDTFPTPCLFNLPTEVRLSRYRETCRLQTADIQYSTDVS
jgi:hypothetical protein